MTQPEYEQNKRECWEEYVNLLNHNSAARYVFDKIFDRAYALGKQEIKPEKDAEDTVISGWVARDGSGPRDLGLRIYTVKPKRMKGLSRWNGHGEKSYLIDSRLFPDISWDDDPQEVEIILKRKKK